MKALHFFKIQFFLSRIIHPCVWFGVSVRRDGNGCFFFSCKEDVVGARWRPPPPRNVLQHENSIQYVVYYESGTNGYRKNGCVLNKKKTRAEPAVIWDRNARKYKYPGTLNCTHSHHLYILFIWHAKKIQAGSEQHLRDACDLTTMQTHGFVSSDFEHKLI